MNRIAHTPNTYNEKQQVLDAINDFFIRVKVSKMDQSDPKVKKVVENYPMLSTHEMDKLHQQINEAFKQYEKQYRKY